MKYTIPETTFEDQIYSLFVCENSPVVQETDLNEIYYIDEDEDEDGNSIVSYSRKYEFFSLYNADFAVDTKTFEDKVFEAFKSHAFCLNERNSLSIIENIFNQVLAQTLNYSHSNKELQKKRFEYFKALINVMNKIIDDKEIKYPSSLFKIAILNEIDDNNLTNKLKENLLYFTKNIKNNIITDIPVPSFYMIDIKVPNAFINYLIILTKFKDEQKEFKNLIWNEFNTLNSIKNAHRLKSVMNVYNLRKIDFNVIDKDILLDIIDINFIVEMRSYLPGKSKIKDNLTDFLDPLTTEEQKKEMFLKSVFNKNLEYKSILIEKKYFPDLIEKINEKDIESVFKQGFFYSPSLEKIISDETNFMVKILGLNYDYGLTEQTARANNLVFLKPVIIEAFKTYNIKEDKKALKKAIGIVKKTKPKERI